MQKHKKPTAIYKDESRLFYFAVTLFISTFVLYMYFLSDSIVHVVMRKEVDSQIASLGTTVSELEAEYIEMQHRVSNDIASLQGFVVADTKIFIDKTEPTFVLLQN